MEICSRHLFHLHHEIGLVSSTDLSVSLASVLWITLWIKDTLTDKFQIVTLACCLKLVTPLFLCLKALEFEGYLEQNPVHRNANFSKRVLEALMIQT